MNKMFKLTAQPDSFVVHKILGEGLDELQVTGFDIQVTDGYHTMEELYDHRRALNVALFNVLGRIDFQLFDGKEAQVIKSKLHNDGTMFEGYFIVVYNSPMGLISYHYDLKYWDDFKIPEVDKVPWEYDGHTAHDVIGRLLRI